MNTLKICLEETWEDVEWTKLVQDTDKLQTFVAATMNIRVS